MREQLQAPVLLPSSKGSCSSQSAQRTGGFGLCWLRETLGKSLGESMPLDESIPSLFEALAAVRALAAPRAGAAADSGIVTANTNRIAAVSRSFTRMTPISFYSHLKYVGN